MEKQVENGIGFGRKDIIVADLRRYDKNIAAGDIKCGVVNMMLAVAGHHNVKLIKVMGMRGGELIGLVVKICLNNLVFLKDFIVSKLLWRIHGPSLLCHHYIFKDKTLQDGSYRQNFPYRMFFAIGILVQYIKIFKQCKNKRHLIIYK
jgi:hypothetical protein